MENIRVKCDKCDWKLAVKGVNEAAEWHRKMCPECGECEIVNDADMDALRTMVTLEVVSDIVDPFNKNRVIVVADSAPLRTGGSLTFEPMGKEI